MKAEQLRADMEREVRQRDEQIHEMMRRQEQLSDKLHSLNATKSLTAQENEELQRERNAFEKEKVQMEQDIQVLRDSYEQARVLLETVKNQQREEKRERAKAAFRLTEGIANEREDLVSELHQLRCATLTYDV